MAKARIICAPFFGEPTGNASARGLAEISLGIDRKSVFEKLLPSHPNDKQHCDSH